MKLEANKVSAPVIFEVRKGAEGAEIYRCNRIRRTTPYGVRGAVRKKCGAVGAAARCGNKCGETA